MSEELTLKVSGMTCGGCESAIKRVLSMVEGVTSATASHQAGEVTVVFDASKTNRARIQRAIETAGYSVAA
jgi:copper chaperone